MKEIKSISPNDRKLRVPIPSVGPDVAYFPVLPKGFALTPDGDVSRTAPPVYSGVGVSKSNVGAGPTYGSDPGSLVSVTAADAGTATSARAPKDAKSVVFVIDLIFIAFLLKLSDALTAHTNLEDAVNKFLKTRKMPILGVSRWDNYGARCCRHLAFKICRLEHCQCSSFVPITGNAA